MKILITTGIFPPDIGGPARIVEKMAEDFSAGGISVEVLTFGKKNEDDKKPYSLSRARNKFCFCLKLLLLSRRVDIIYAFDLYTAGFCSWLIGKVLMKKKFIVRFAGDSAWEAAVNKGCVREDLVAFQNKRYGLKIEMLKSFRARILRGADRVVVVSNYLKEIAGLIGVVSSRIVLIYNSVDFIRTANLTPANIRNELGIRDDDVVIMTSGRLVPWKGMEGVVKALAEVKSELPDLSDRLRLIIVGDGPERDRLGCAAEECGVKENVVFTGKVPQDEVVKYYREADIFILNSQYEGLSHVLLEALSVHKPIIASNAGGNPEVIADEVNGLLVEFNNISQIKNAIIRIIREDKWRSDDHARRCEESLKRFSWTEELAKTTAVFNAVLSL